MPKQARDAIFGALIGSMLGALPGVLAEGAYVTWRMGGDLGQIDLWTYFRLLPGIGALFAGEFGRGAAIGLGVMGAAMIAGVTLSSRSDRTSSARRSGPRPTSCAARACSRVGLISARRRSGIRWWRRRPGRAS